MSLRKSISFAIIATLTSSLPGGAAHANAPRCSLGHYTPIASQPYRVDYDSDYGDFSILYGARLYVPAQPGLTREWLARDLMHALAQPVGMDSSCRPPVEDVQISVESAGPGFWVTLKARDEREGALLVRWASTLTAQSGAVQR